MDTDSIRNLVIRKAGVAPDLRQDAPDQFSAVAASGAIKAYLVECVVTESFTASGVAVAGLERLVAENLGGASPGCFVYPHGFLVVATSVGGNAICLDAETDAVYWLDHSSFSEDFIVFEDPSSGELREFYEYSSQNIRSASKKIGDDIENTICALLGDELTEVLEALD